MQHNKRCDRKRIKIILTFPRCGTHFIWSRYVSSGRYQLIYDADRLPALTVLANRYKGKLDFLHPAQKNPNYNFQYNSLSRVDRYLTADEHLEVLSKRYSAKRGKALFDKIMSVQDTDGRCLFSINRFIYNISYDFIFKDFTWTVEYAKESLQLLCKWLSLGEYNYSLAMVIRDIPDWVMSQKLLMGTKVEYRISKRIMEMIFMLKACLEFKISIYRMEDVIRIINNDILEFENELTPLQINEVNDTVDQLKIYYEMLKDNSVKINPLRRAIRMDRLVQYLSEKDQIKRTSLVLSIGWVPIKLLKYLPYVCSKFKYDLEGTILDNAKVKL